MPNSEIYSNGLTVNYQYENNKPDIQSVKYSGDINIKDFQFLILNASFQNLNIALSHYP